MMRVNVDMRIITRAYLDAYKYFVEDKSARDAVIVLPTGAGKTGVMALVPYGISTGRVFIITPQLVIIELIENMSKLIEKKDVFEDIELVLIPIKIIIHPDDDLIFAPYHAFENDGRKYPFYDFEGLKEVDTEAFCVRISRVKQEIQNLLDEIIEFLWEYEWEDEVYFERENDNKVGVSASLFADEDSTAAKITLAVSLHISGLHKSGDLIFDTEYDLGTGSLSFQTEGCDFNLDVDDIQDLFLECWSSADHYVKIQNEIESELENEN